MLNATASHAAKQQGMQLALQMSGDWRDEILIELRGWIAMHKARGHTTMTVEQFRAEARNQPASHKAWGAFTNMARAEGLIAPMQHPDGSPVMRLAESVKTHRHPVRCWRLL